MKFVDFVTSDRPQDKQLYEGRKVLPAILGSNGFKDKIFKK
ncbi:MAG: hypothetical protein V4694_00050 [Pseudomonadota bacterium]